MPYFFEQPEQKTRRSGHNAPQNRRKIGKAVPDPQRGAAEHGEIEGRAREVGEEQPCAHRPPAEGNGDEKDRPRHGEPEEQIERGADEAPVHPHAQDAQSVVRKPYEDPQHETLEQGAALRGDVDLHQPNSREKRPPRRTSSS